jgi:hypothetical protein
MYNKIKKEEKILTNDQAIAQVLRHEPNSCTLTTDTHMIWMSANHIHLKCKRGYGTDTRRVNAFHVTSPTVDVMTIEDDEASPQVISKLMAVATLKEQCTARGLKTGGTKAVLLRRLNDYSLSHSDIHATLSEGEEE